MRLFVAVDLGETLKGRVTDIQSHLRRTLSRAGSGADLNWVPSDRFHLTLRFIGELPDDTGSSVATALAPAFDEPAFRLALGGPGMFPLSGRPRVLWLGVTEGVEPLRRVAIEVERRLTAVGLPPEPRPFSPHLTLARFKEPGTAHDRERLERARLEPPGGCRIDHVTLYKSRLSPKGPTYTPLARTPLGAGGEAS